MDDVNYHDIEFTITYTSSSRGLTAWGPFKFYPQQDDPLLIALLAKAHMLEKTALHPQMEDLFLASNKENNSVG